MLSFVVSTLAVCLAASVDQNGILRQVATATYSSIDHNKYSLGEMYILKQRYAGSTAVQ